MEKITMDRKISDARNFREASERKQAMMESVKKLDDSLQKVESTNEWYVRPAMKQSAEDAIDDDAIAFREARFLERSKVGIFLDEKEREGKEKEGLLLDFSEAMEHWQEELVEKETQQKPGSNSKNTKKDLKKVDAKKLATPLQSSARQWAPGLGAGDDPHGHGLEQGALDAVLEEMALDIQSTQHKRKVSSTDADMK